MIVNTSQIQEIRNYIKSLRELVIENPSTFTDVNDLNLDLLKVDWDIVESFLFKDFASFVKENVETLKNPLSAKFSALEQGKIESVASKIKFLIHEVYDYFDYSVALPAIDQYIRARKDKSSGDMPLIRHKFRKLSEYVYFKGRISAAERPKYYRYQTFESAKVAAPSINISKEIMAELESVQLEDGTFVLDHVENVDVNPDKMQVQITLNEIDVDDFKLEQLRMVCQVFFKKKYPGMRIIVRTEREISSKHTTREEQSLLKTLRGGTRKKSEFKQKNISTDIFEEIPESAYISDKIQLLDSILELSDALGMIIRKLSRSDIADISYPCVYEFDLREYHNRKKSLNKDETTLLRYVLNNMTYIVTKSEEFHLLYFDVMNGRKLNVVIKDIIHGLLNVDNKEELINLELYYRSYLEIMDVPISRLVKINAIERMKKENEKITLFSNFILF